MKEQKLAIVKSDMDLLRVILLKTTPTPKGTAIDLKISTLGNSYSLQYWHQGVQDPEVYTTHSEITYHSSKKGDEELLPGTVHVKERDTTGEINYRCRFPKVADVLIDSEFPIPLLRLVVAGNRYKVYKRKPYHFVIDIDNQDIRPSNVLEIYVVSKEFDVRKFWHKWPNISLLWEMASINYVTQGVHLNQLFLEKLESSPSLSGMGYKFEDFDFLFKFHADKEAKDDQICFYENHDYLSMLGTSLIQLVDERTDQPLSEIKPAFLFDLEWQKKRGIGQEKIEFWHKVFGNAYNRLKPINRTIFKVPQI